MILVLLLCISLLFLSFICSKNNILSPGVITSGIWVICLSLFLILHHNLPPLSSKFLGALSLWVTLLCLSSLLMQSVTFKVEKREPSAFVRDIFFWISVVTFPFFLLFVLDALKYGETGNWSMDLRLAALGKTSKFKEIYGGIHIIIWQVSYLIELFYYSKKTRKRVFILGLFLLCFGFFTMAKASFLDLFLKTVCILYFKNKISVKQILTGVGALFFLLIFIQSLRYSTNVQSENKNDLFVLYLLSNMSAFDTLIPGSSAHWGENVFRFYYSAAYKLGISAIEPIDPLLPFIKKPISTNTYSVMYPFFKDFGYTGVILFAILYGIFYGWIFRRAQQGDGFYVLLYVTFIPIILMQYSSEIFITSLLAYLKVIILLGIPFWAAKFKVFNQAKFIKIKL